MATKRKRSDFASAKSASRKKIPSSKVLQMVLESSDSELCVNMSCDNESDFMSETSEDESDSETTPDDVTAADDDTSDNDAGTSAVGVNDAGNCSAASTTANAGSRRQKTSKPQNHDDHFIWMQNVQQPCFSFMQNSGFRNIPDSFSDSTSLEEFLYLFLDETTIEMMVTYTNLRALQTKVCKSNDYYANSWTDVTAEEMRAFLAVRLSMEHLLIRPRLSSYFGDGKKN